MKKLLPILTPLFIDMNPSKKVDKYRYRHLLSGLVLSSCCISPLVQATPVINTEPTQQDKVGKMAEDYLVAHPEKVGEAMATYLAEHPEFLIAAGESLRQRQEVSQRQMMQQLALQKTTDLLNLNSPSVGPVDAKTAVVIFFDYQCVYCSKMSPLLTSFIKSHPDVRFVFKEYPIFSQRWPISGFAARVGEAVWFEKGAAAYQGYHDALFATGKVEGALTEEDVKTSARPYLTDEQVITLTKAGGADPASQAVAQNLALGQQLQLSGTPAFVVLPQQVQQVKASTLTVLPGSTTQESLQQAINIADAEMLPPSKP